MFQHVVGIYMNVFLLITFQVIFFLTYGKDMLARTVFRENAALGDIINTCSAVIPGTSTKDPDGTGRMAYQRVLETIAENADVSEKVADSASQNGNIHTGIVAFLALLLVGFLLLLGVAIQRNVYTGKQILFLVAIGLLSYFSEILFLLFVVERWQFFTFRDILFELTKPSVRQNMLTLAEDLGSIPYELGFPVAPPEVA